jgi:hypothetical protein
MTHYKLHRGIVNQVYVLISKTNLLRSIKNEQEKYSTPVIASNNFHIDVYT